MVTKLLILGLLLGLDSFAVCLALGTLPRPPLRRRWLVVSFALCDGLASWVGAAGLRPLPFAAGWLGPAAVAAYGLYVLALAWRARRALAGGAEGWLVLVLPVCLSLDNLAAGTGSATGAPAPLGSLAQGAASGLMAFAGLWAGEAVGKRLPISPVLGGGVALIAAALALALA